MNSIIEHMKKKNKSGMTLIEVIVALAILGIIVIGLLPLFSTSTKMLVNNGKQINDMYSKQNITEEQISKGTDSNVVIMKVVFSGKEINVVGENISTDSYNIFIPYSKKITP